MNEKADSSDDGEVGGGNDDGDGDGNDGEDGDDDGGADDRSNKGQLRRCQDSDTLPPVM